MVWVSALEAIKAMGAIGDEYNGSPQARSIRQHAYEGLLRSRARLLWRLTSRTKETEENVLLTEEFWRAQESKTSQQDWLTGRFSSFLQPAYLRIMEEWRAYGVEFSKEDVEAMGGRFDPSTSAYDAQSKPKRGRAGPKHQMDRWHSFYMAVVQLAQEGRLNKTCFPSQASLWEEIALEMGDGAWDPDYAKPFVSQIYRKFVGD